MITAQRIYQANAQTIKTQDQVMQTWSTCVDPGRTHRTSWTASSTSRWPAPRPRMQRQDVLANNLANASTNGLSCRDAGLSVPCRCAATGPAPGSTRWKAPGLQRPAGAGAEHRPALDVAMQGNAWLAVQALDGTEAYTRAGSLQVDAEGQLVTAAGCRCWARAARSRCRPVPR
jgi:flagellar basal body rod protein FlgG